MGVVSGQAGKYARSTAGMVGAMVVVVLIVVAFVLFRDVNRTDPRSPVRDVDYAQAAAYARDQATFDLVAPEQLPAGWQATSVEYVPGSDEHWHIGLLTDEEQYVGLEQADASPDSLLETHVDPVVERAGSVDVDGEQWSRWTDDGGDVALVRRSGDTTTLVVGHDVPAAELAAFAASLR
jgi:hypothetical protein